MAEETAAVPPDFVTSRCDLADTAAVRRLGRKCRRAVTVLLVEQNARQALRIANWSYVLEKGRVTLSGQAEHLMEDPQVVEAYLGEA